METYTLILTPWMSPHKIVNWQRSMELLVGGKIDVLEEYDQIIRSASLSFSLPAVARLRKNIHGFKKGVKFSRVNVFTRDGFCCQYCGERKPARELNYEHVIPRAQGGKTEWENIVTACYPCNNRKGSKTPAQAGMTLRKKPVRPKTLPLTAPSWDASKVPPLWLPYLDIQSSGWAIEMVELASAHRAAV
jgi:5-methylcytosine-specific restriction endonuclease McrA